MKTMKFFAVALAALTMASCSNESEPNGIDPSLPGEQAKVTLQITGTADNQPQGRATGDGETEEAKVNNVVVYFFRAAGADDATTKLDTEAPYFKNSGLDDIQLTATTNAKSVYIIANTGLANEDAFKASPYASVKTLADLKALKGDLMSGEATQTSKNLFMAGGAANNISFVGTEGTATVKLAFVASKIVVTITDERKNKNLDWATAGTKITIEDKSIALLFAGGEGSFFGDATAKVTQTKFYSGIATGTGIPAKNVTVKAILNTPLELNADKTIKSDSYHFYTFAHESALTRQGGSEKLPIVVTIVSDKKTSKEGTAVETYYPVHFDVTDALKGKTPTTFQPGMKYTVAIKLTGDVNGGDGGGTTDPEIPVVDANITVTVTPATWAAAIVISKEFS